MKTNNDVRPVSSKRRNAGAETAPAESALLDVREVSELLRCSTRHVYRLSDAGKLPIPRHLGSLVRWSRYKLLKWVADGCPTVRIAKRGNVR